jgi:hypothetical protein
LLRLYRRGGDNSILGPVDRELFEPLPGFVIPVIPHVGSAAFFLDLAKRFAVLDHHVQARFGLLPEPVNHLDGAFLLFVGSDPRQFLLKLFFDKLGHN